MHLYRFFSNSLKLPQEVLSLGISVSSSQVPFTNRKNYLRAYFIIKEETFIPGSLTE
jgi:hypothetical protein